MGNQLSSSQTNEDIGRLLLGLEYFTQEGQSIENSRVFTVVKLSADQYNLMLAKVHIKQKEIDLTVYKQRFDSIKASFSKAANPNLLLSDYIETSKLMIVLRQYCATTLRKKLISPPFLNMTEKLWLSYQCLMAVKQIHDNGVCHGDIKSENFLTTSWNWLFLADISNVYKPWYLIEGDLTSYNLYFSNSERPACYLSPEKFVNRIKEDFLTAEMDIFSLGCVLAEIFLDGQCLFTLPELLSYKRQDLKTPAKLSEIKNELIKEMISSMISFLPENRKSISFYKNFWETKIIPCEMSFLYPLVAQLMINNLATPWLRISAVIEIYGKHKKELENSEVLLILAELITGNIRNVSFPANMVTGIDILTEIGKKLSDDSKLHRILPYLISILQNKQEKSKVKVCCIRSIVELLENITNISARDSHLFNEYIWPVISSLIHDESDWVRTELSKSLPKMAKIGRVFFEVSVSQLSSEINFDKEILVFTARFVKIFKDLIVSKPEGQVHIELLRNFSELAEFLDMRAVLNNIIPIVLSWLNKGDAYRLLILTQIPKLLNIIHTPDFFSQIFTCIEDGLIQHNEIVVFLTLKVFKISPKLSSSTIFNAVLGLLYPNRWIREEIISILRTLVKSMNACENYSMLRPLVIEFLDLPKNAVGLVTEEVLGHVIQSFKRSDFLKDSNDSPFFKKVAEVFKTKEPFKTAVPVITDGKTQTYEEPFSKAFSSISFDPDPVKVLESLNIKGNLQSCFNEHECSVTNICVIENSQAFLSGSSDGTLKLWSLAQLEPFKSIKSEELFRSNDKPWRIRSIGNCGDEVFVAHEQGIVVSGLQKFQPDTVFSDSKLLKAVSLGEHNIVSVNQKGLLTIYDIRQQETAQKYELGYNYGLVSCLCKGSASTLSLGTLSSALIVYDMRFNCPSMVYYHSSGLPILSISSYNDNSLLVAGDDISLLDLHSATATVVLAAYSSNPVIVPSFRETFDSEWIVKNCANISHRTRKTFENSNTVRKILSPGPPFVISGGHDCLVRCWDINNPSKSFIVGQDSSLKPSFSLVEYPDVQIIQENSFSYQSGNYSINKSLKRKEYSEIPNHRRCSHTDAILDIAFLTQPKHILLTASRDGTIKAWN